MALGICSTLGCAKEYLEGNKFKLAKFSDSLRTDPSFLKSHVPGNVWNWARAGYPFLKTRVRNVNYGTAAYLTALYFRLLSRD